MLFNSGENVRLCLLIKHLSMVSILAYISARVH